MSVKCTHIPSFPQNPLHLKVLRMYQSLSATPQFPEFGLPFDGKLDPSNRWIIKSKLIPWDLIEKEYIKGLSGSTTGSPATQSRMAFGALIIKEELGVSDRETVEQIKETPYLQFLVGLEDFQTESPFDASMMVVFRKRFPEKSLNKINEAMVLKTLKSKMDHCEKGDDDSDENLQPLMESSDESVVSEMHKMGEGNEEVQPKNKGKLIMDATCAPADIHYPTDLKLLNDGREKTEQIIDCLHSHRTDDGRKPRTYRDKARKDYLKVAKKKQKSRKIIRKASRKQLGYLRRNLGYIEVLSNTVSLGFLSRRLYQELFVINEMYRQQQLMYDQKTNRIDDRIVSLCQPHVRPIIRGKAGAGTEFGAKLHGSLVCGFMFSERIDWNNFNEGKDLITVAEAYYQRLGFYPKSIHADKIYRTRENRKWCKDHDIRLSGPPLGRPPKDTKVSHEQKQIARQDEIDRIPIEGKFGQGKRRFGLAKIMAKLAVTSVTVISLNLIVMNLEKLFRLCSSGGSFLSLFLWFVRLRIAFQDCFEVLKRCSCRFRYINALFNPTPTLQDGSHPRDLVYLKT